MSEGERNMLIRLILSFIFYSQAQPLSKHIEESLGMNFVYSGPNCFATSLYAHKSLKHFRKVSLEEMQSFLKNFCHKVTTPQTNDIGVYYTDDLRASHSFFYLKENLAYEKANLFTNSTPRLNSITNIDHIHRATQLCRQYGDETCHSNFSYFRCSPAERSAQFNKVALPLEKNLEQILTGQTTSYSKTKLENKIESLSLLAKSDYEVSVLISLRMQMGFLDNTQKPL